ncbi:MAG: Crp/Fnr family transcriptional regulator [Chitinophagaceae bacterium]|nr:MAG: Crp/Fnr family transcriptional regulator [Chitinophagaceae bacterium]
MISTTDQLINHIRKFVLLPDNTAGALQHFFTVHTIRKKENLVQAGQICRSHYFVLKGCLRMFYITEKGVEQTMQFGLENWWITDYMSFQNRQQTQYSIQAVEETDVLSIDHSSYEKLLSSHPVLEKYFRVIYQRTTAAAQVRLKYIYDLSKEEMYKDFAARFPDFIQRIPQYLLASYLGCTPEYLSEIRKKIAS